MADGFQRFARVRRDPVTGQWYRYSLKLKPLAFRPFWLRQRRRLSRQQWVVEHLRWWAWWPLFVLASIMLVDSLLASVGVVDRHFRYAAAGHAYCSNPVPIPPEYLCTGPDCSARDKALAIMAVAEAEQRIAACGLG